MEKLKRCPFCGGEAKADFNKNKQSDAWFVFIRCKCCNATGQSIYLGPLMTRADCDAAMKKIDEVSERATLAWNRRTGYKEGQS